MDDLTIISLKSIILIILYYSLSFAIIIYFTALLIYSFRGTFKTYLSTIRINILLLYYISFSIFLCYMILWTSVPFLASILFFSFKGDFLRSIYHLNLFVTYFLSSNYCHWHFNLFSIEIFKYSLIYFVFCIRM